METKAHQYLKRAAEEFLRLRGCRILAFEVQCPISRYRVDVAGYVDLAVDVAASDGTPAMRRCEPRTVVIECKQSREDFLRDAAQIEPLLQQREHYQRICTSIEENRIKRLEPQLRKAGTSLFTELDEWDFSGSRLRGYRRVLRLLRRMDEKLHGETKFFFMARYRLADEMYLAAPRGVIRPREVPHGWGLLECEPYSIQINGISTSTEPALRTTRPAPIHLPRTEYRLRLLRNIAAAACRSVHLPSDSSAVRAPA